MQYLLERGGDQPASTMSAADARWTPASFGGPNWNGNNATTATVNKTGAILIDGILSGIKWKGSITYSAPNSLGDYGSGYFSGMDTSDFSAFSSQQLSAFHAAMNKSGVSAGFSVTGFTNLKASFVGGGSGAGTVRGANMADANPTAYAFYPSDHVKGGDMFFGTTQYGTGNSLKEPVPGNWAWHTMYHELGHALGLKHGHETGGVAGKLPTAFDTIEYTVMTYSGYRGSNGDGYHYEPWGAPQTFMMADIAALQHMYGADFTTNSGNTTYKWLPTSGNTYVNGKVAIAPGDNRIFATIWDGGGVDTYDLSAYTTRLNLNLAPGGPSFFSQVQRAYLGGGPEGGFASGNIYNAFQYKGDPRSLIENAIGGSGDDIINGNAADNKLYGGGGDDLLAGGDGNDLLDGGPGRDRLLGGSGTDTASYASAAAGVTASLASPSSNTGDAEVDRYTSIENLQGSRYADRLTGNNGTNVLEGGPGADVLDGRGGTDTASYASAKARVIVNLSRPSENRGDAQGDRYSSIENVIGSRHGDTLTGNGSANDIRGEAGNDRLYGGSGHDKLDGGSGNDRLYGDSGNDRLYGGTGGDTVYGGSGNDRMYGASGNDKLYGGAGSDRGYGEAGNDSLYGRGGNDRLYGAAGNDSLQGDAGTDRLYGGTGNDTAYGGTGTDYLYGGAGGDRLNGDSGNDFLYGGAGNDRLNGGNGNDAAYGGNGNDRLVGGAGTDKLYGDGGDDKLYGGGGGDRLYGGNGNDFAYGGNGSDRAYGGLGRDTLYGGNGNDQLYGGNGGDRLYGDAGDDDLYGGRGNDRIDGGGGVDYAYFSGKYAEYSVTTSGSVTTVNHVGGAKLDGVDRLVHVEYAVFADGTLEL